MVTELTFLGTGTSQGVPMIGCECSVCTSYDQRDKRLRTSALVRQGDVTVVIDTGPDFRQQMLREKVTALDAILYTHEHMDHTCGMDDIRAFNYLMGQPMDIYCEARVEKLLRKNFDYAFAEHKYPGVPDVVVHNIGVEPFAIQTMEVTPIRGTHYRLPVLGFKIGNICYITDMNHIDDAEIEKFKGVDILIINALRREKHISHFTLDQALGVIRKAQPRKAYLIHMSHQLGRHEQLSAELPEGVYSAYDGLTIKA